ncbi:MAG TPA: hypothetical protein PKY81_15840, partial [bacterium]|nr:hypothetical protein [bacterium]
NDTDYFRWNNPVDWLDNQRKPISGEKIYRNFTDLAHHIRTDSEAILLIIQSDSEAKNYRMNLLESDSVIKNVRIQDLENFKNTINDTYYTEPEINTFLNQIGNDTELLRNRIMLLESDSEAKNIRINSLEADSVIKTVFLNSLFADSTQKNIRLNYLENFDLTLGDTYYKKGIKADSFNVNEISFDNGICSNTLYVNVLRPNYLYTNVIIHPENPFDTIFTPGNLESAQNITAAYFAGDGSKLTNISVDNIIIDTESLNSKYLNINADTMNADWNKTINKPYIPDTSPYLLITDYESGNSGFDTVIADSRYIRKDIEEIINQNIFFSKSISIDTIINNINSSETIDSVTNSNYDNNVYDINYMSNDGSNGSDLNWDMLNGINYSGGMSGFGYYGFNRISKYFKILNINFADSFNCLVNKKITGIKITLACGFVGTNNYEQYIHEVKLVKNGIICGESKADITNVYGSVHYINLGGDTDLWGLNLTYQDVLSESFGFVIAVQQFNSQEPFNLYRAYITIYYSDFGYVTISNKIKTNAIKLEPAENYPNVETGDDTGIEFYHKGTNKKYVWDGSEWRALW